MEMPKIEKFFLKYTRKSFIFSSIKNYNSAIFLKHLWKYHLIPKNLLVIEILRYIIHESQSTMINPKNTFRKFSFSNSFYTFLICFCFLSRFHLVLFPLMDLFILCLSVQVIEVCIDNLLSIRFFVVAVVFHYENPQWVKMELVSDFFMVV